MSSFDPIVGSQPQRPAQGNATTQPSREDEKPEITTQADTPEAVEPAARSSGGSTTAGGFSARLNYDLASDHVVIEILDPRTGEVLRQLPPEDAAEELGGGGHVVNRVA